MKIVSRLIAALTLVALTGSVFAQSVSVGSAAGQIGNPVVLEPSFTAGAQEVDVVQFVVTFANPALANFSSVTVDATCGGSLGSASSNQCVVNPTASAFQIIVSSGTSAMPSGTLASITFSIDGAATAGDVALVVDPASIVIGRNGVPADPAVPVSDGNIVISEGPQPEFTGTPLGLAMATEQNLANPTGSLTVTNTGEATSLLTGTCSLLAGGDSQISMSNGSFTDIAVGAAGSVVGVACDASAAGSYAATLSCDHNGSNTNPADFPVTCEISPPGAASYVSTPVPGATIEMTPDGDVPVGATVPDQVLTITNGATDANDNDLVLSNCALTGGGDITAAGPGSTTIAPTASTTVTFSCSAANVGDYTGTYSCDYDTDGDGSSDGSASYTVNCGVRAAASDIVESPIGDGSNTLFIVVPINGSGQTSVSFEEILDEGVDATVDSCAFTTGTSFTVVSTLPVTVAAGSTEMITVEGMDPADGSFTVEDTLTCTYTDSDSTPGTASWPITMAIQTAAIPTLSSWGLMLMILTMLGLGGIVIRRKTLS